jgi:excisionase family DNA binding protein
MITVPRTLKTKPKKVSNQESDIQWLIIDKYFLDLSQNELGLRVITHLTAEQLAERLGIHLNTIYKWARAGKIPGIKLSRSKRGDWRFPVDKIEEWEKQRMTGV